MIKALFFDLDGTLLTKEKRVSALSEQTLKKCKQKGIKLFIATARPPLLKNMLSWSDEFFSLFEGGSYYNGGCVVANGAKEYITVLPDLVDDVVAHIEKQELLNVSLQLEDEKHAFRFPLDDGAYKAWGILPSEAMKLSVRHSMKTVKIIIFYANLIDSVTMLDNDFVLSIKELCENRAQFYLTDSGKSIQIMGAGVNKLQSIKRICTMYEYESDEVAVFGDDVNDIEMLSAFEHSIAMGNAEEQIKNIAKFTTLDNNSEGITYAITNILHLVE